MLDYEVTRFSEYGLIAGIDEAGRGPLAGPVCVAAVIMPKTNLLQKVNDSKKLSPKVREELFPQIVERALSYSIVFVDNGTVDAINILQATRRGMEEAAEGLGVKPDIILVDAVAGLRTGAPNVPIIKGDTLSYNIAAASILAKVSRDRLMCEYDKQYPEYGFAKHKGYGTLAHVAALKEYGPCELHRKSFIKNFFPKD
jgi:ribonuclease HII